ncbi:MAG: hypothetical protein P4L46_04680 [Fimbriimonas sp.]|nr:hypothetical protein [Fimbriimonas sp.]
MTGTSLASLIAIILVSSVPLPKEVIAAKYKQFNAIYLKGNRTAMDAWIKGNCLTGFAYTSYHKTKYSRDGFRASILQDMANTSKVIQSTLVVRQVQKQGTAQSAIIASEFKGNVVIDSRRFVLTDKSVDTDTWVQVGKDWKLKQRVEVNEDMQLQPDD